MPSRKQPVRILELRSVWGTGGGPEKTILLGAARTDPARYAITVCYLRQEGDPHWTMAARARRYDIDYVEIHERHSFDPRIWTRLRDLIRERRIELVHAHDYKTDFLAWLAALRCGTTPLSTAHGFMGGGRKEKIYYHADKKILARFARVICVATDIAAELVRSGVPKERICTLLNAIDPERFLRDPERVPAARAALGVPRGAVAIGAIGRLEEQKRFDELIDALRPLVAEGRDLHLFIAGEGSRRAALERQIVRLGLQGRVHLCGQVDDIAAFHHGLDLFVQSSVREGTPNAVLEAMAFETPIVATHAGGTRELVQHGAHALLTPIADAARLAMTLREALDDAPGRADRAARARRRVETELSFARRMERVEAIYDALVAERRRGAP